ncbi:MAG: HlyD family efflux transporter periplasmic adaptor subunit [Candidatus Accumulibacter sp.]|uniref:efflux RND transporter periplasmic adaptor subunit n=1 Tax=Accumulibacter sp. TaxID=2053492 RepID=UPI0025FF53A8|nr:HlyD family efflux transporter periplasmic adaptor subunit [Accumulibacter sp.]MCM8600535.1 HlyD family efflux transporter periplasmic adaptor subunit [Accumulibacter sp.]
MQAGAYSSRTQEANPPSGAEGQSGFAADDALWAAFASAQTAADFCASWLSLQCRQVGEARCALLLLEQEGSTFVPAAVWPSPSSDVTHLAPAAQQCLGERRGLVVRQLGLVIVAYPVELEGQVQGAVVLDVAERADAALQAVLRQLHWGIGWIETLFLRRRRLDDAELLQRARSALDVLAVAAEHERLPAMAMAVVNDLASRFACDRVSLGIERGGRARLLAMSHSAFFEKKSQFVAALENAMDEAFDQRRSIVFPPIEEGSGGLAIAHRDFAATRCVCSVVLASGGVGVGVLTCERSTPFSADDLRAFEAVAALLGPPLDNRIELQRWFAGRLVDQLRSGWRHLGDSRRPALRVGLTLGAVFLLAVVLLDGDYRVSAKAVVEGEVQRAAVAPFDGFVRTAPVRAGFVVRQGELLATLDDRDLLVERQRWLAEREQHQGRYRDALAKHERANANVSLAQVQQAESQLVLVEEKLLRANIVAPFDGVVVSGDLTQLLGSPVEQGKLLFEIAPLDAYRVILKVEDRDIRDVRVGQEGKLMLTGLAGEALAFAVHNISMAEAEDGRNVFRVEARLERSDLKLRPGMEGVGKIDVGRQSYAWIWTHRLTDWLRLQLWTWLP